MPGLMLGKRHIADPNQNIAEPHAAIIAPVSMNDLIITPNGSGTDRDYTANAAALPTRVMNFRRLMQER
jgi:hypothetical protein